MIGAARRTVPSVSKPATKCSLPPAVIATTRTNLIIALPGSRRVAFIANRQPPINVNWEISQGRRTPIVALTRPSKSSLSCVFTFGRSPLKRPRRQEKRKSKAAMPRPADIAVIISQMMVELAVLIHQHEPYQRRNLGASLEEMFVSFMLNAAAGADRPLTPTEIAERLSIPRSNVRRHLTTLAQAGRVRQIGNGYMTDLDQLNGNAPLERFLDIKRMVTKASWELTRLRLDDEDQSPPD